MKISSLIISGLALLSFSRAVQASPSRLQERRALAVAERYCEAFIAHDGVKMAALYEDSEDVVFSDPVFGPLDSRHTKAMWRMLMLKPENLQVQCKVTKQVGRTVFIAWQANYIFSKTKRPVSNYAETVMQVVGNKILQQTDSFDLCNWTLMALGDQTKVVCTNPEKTIRPQMLGAIENFLRLTEAAAARR